MFLVYVEHVLVFLYSQASDVGETHNFNPGTVLWTVRHMNWVSRFSSTVILLTPLSVRENSHIYNRPQRRNSDPEFHEYEAKNLTT